MPQGVPTPVDSNTTSTVSNWIAASIVALLGAFALKKTHDIGQEERKGEDLVSRTRAKAYEMTGKNESGAKIRSDNRLQNLEKGAQVVGERISGIASSMFAVGKQAAQDSQEALKEAKEKLSESVASFKNN